ncbi:MAG TPA: hypothetical protein IAB40_04715 [Candidatus Onthocola stercoravium]|nr:hypothetical protein [Candidatus Onthocola stercoravium]
MFNNIWEEENAFPYPYTEMSLEESRLIRYLVRNFYAFRNGELITMTLKNTNGIVLANGSVYEKNKNKTFNSEIEYIDNGMVFYSEIEEAPSKRYYSIDEFIFMEKDIEVRSKINGRNIIRKIPYESEDRELK